MPLKGRRAVNRRAVIEFPLMRSLAGDGGDMTAESIGSAPLEAYA